MRIFEDTGGTLNEMPHLGFKKEKEIQRMVEHNLDVIFPGLEMVRSEFRVGGKRIDTLAYDPKGRVFVIIEYKKRDGAEMTDQVSVYRDTVMTNQSDCELALIKKYGRVIDTNNIRWPKTRVIFVKPDFTKQQIDAWGRKDLVDLCEVRKFQDAWIVNQFGKTDAFKPKSQYDARHRPPRNSSSDSKQYSESAWLAGKSHCPPATPQNRDLYFTLKDRMFAEFQIKHVQKSRYAGFYADTDLVCCVQCQKHGLKLIYATRKPDQLPLNNFVEPMPPRRWGRHFSILQQQSDIVQALEYLRITYDLKSSNKHRS